MMGSEFISKAAVEEVLEKAQIISDGENCGYCTQDVNISAIPAADVAPVVHGQWDKYAERRPFGEVWLECSRCGSHNGTMIKFNYCPDCGAKMDE